MPATGPATAPTIARATSPDGPARALRALLPAFLILLLVGAAAPVAAANDGRAAFERGVTAAGDGDFATAVTHFEAARRAGLDTGALHFNLGVAYYRTGRVEAATRAFRRAAATRAMAGPALYQLGRIAREQGRTAAARDHFRRALARAGTDRLRSAARSALGETGPAPPDYRYVEAGGGYDSNVTLGPEDAAVASEEGAGFADLYAIARHPVGARFYLRGSAYAQHFPEDSDFDLLSLRGGAGRVGRLAGDWRWDARLDLRHQRFGGDAFETALLPGVRLRHRLGPGWSLALGYRLALARGGDDFAFLDGTGHRLRAVLDERGAAGWRLQATLRRLDRDDLATGDDFFSFSRDELELEARYAFVLGDATRLALRGDWTRREYDGAEVRGGAVLGVRDDERTGAGVELRRFLDADWSVRATLRAEERDSNLAALDYERAVLAVRVERFF